MKTDMCFPVMVVCLITSCFCYAIPTQWSVSSGGNGHFYEVIVQNTSWLAAQISAGQKTHMGTSGHLATITSSGEQSFIVNLIANAGVDSALVGGYQDSSAPDFSEPAGGWRWITGEEWVYDNWIAGEPSHNFPGEEVVHVYSANYTFTPGFAGGWNDIPEEYVLEGNNGYVVEYSKPIPIPVPGALVLCLFGTALFSSTRKKNG